MEDGFVRTELGFYRNQNWSWKTLIQQHTTFIWTDLIPIQMRIGQTSSLTFLIRTHNEQTCKRSSLDLLSAIAVQTTLRMPSKKSYWGLPLDISRLDNPTNAQCSKQSFNIEEITLLELIGHQISQLKN